MSDRRSFLPRRRPENIIRPTTLRHRDEPPLTPEQQARKIELSLLFQGSLLSSWLGFAILIRCGVHPADDAQRKSYAAANRIRTRGLRRGPPEHVPRAAWEDLQNAATVLRNKLPCSHCEGRRECQAAFQPYGRGADV